jgi:hypothetical protein
VHVKTFLPHFHQYCYANLAQIILVIYIFSIVIQSYKTVTKCSLLYLRVTLPVRVIIIHLELPAIKKYTGC